MILLPGQTEEDASKCPKCGSDDVAIGACVLECFACGWHHLQKYPCTICGKPATGVVSGSNGKGTDYTYYGCSEHPVSDEIIRKAMEDFAKSIVENSRGNEDQDRTLPGPARQDGQRPEGDA